MTPYYYSVVEISSENNWQKFFFDSLGQIVRAESNEATVTRIYGYLGKVLEEKITGPSIFSPEVLSSFDALGRCTSIQLPDSSKIIYSYQGLFSQSVSRLSSDGKTLYSHKMEINDFYEFDSKLLSSTFQAHSVGLRSGKNGISDHWNLIKGLYSDINFPVVFKQEYGKILTDILDTGWVNLFLISDRMKMILEENKLTGWKTFPIKLYKKNGNEISGYNGFSIIGRCSFINYEKCELIEKRMVPNGPICKFYKGASINFWDGSDFFTPEGTYEIFITKKAADALKKSKISNVHLEKLANKETDIDNIKNHQ